MNKVDYPSLEFCRKLTEAKFPSTEKVMYSYKDGPQIGDPHWVWLPENPYVQYVCPSVTEMLNIMPKLLDDKLVGDLSQYFLSITYCFGELVVSYEKGMRCLHKVQGTLPNALAEMILWLQKSNYISFPN